ncbi:DUF4157 domain-containing protein [Paenibacillus humicola]|uniref:eCIS core domain-containing protein n=1 Tax=Paenibacillus humicola TaxID=3110540 RepID=UPI00237B4DC9|nr:DUF4157 domain-containing protein [Paenibacillus humicola]
MRTFGSGKSIRKMDQRQFERTQQKPHQTGHAQLQRALASGAPLGAAEMQALQRAAGNGAMLRMAGAGGRMAIPVMAKMTINNPSDAYELEADQVAYRVANDLRTTQSAQATGQAVQRMAGPEDEEELQLKPDAAGPIQREVEPMEEESEELQLKPDAAGPIKREAEAMEEKGEELQLKRDPFALIQRAAAGASEASGSVEARIEDSRGKGQRLQDGMREQLEGSFGTDFSDVTIHTDNTADELSKSVGARAFTTGSDIFFRQGEYKPDTSGGLQLLSHELTHVVQQKGR